MHSEELGRLVQQDDEADAGLEAGEYRRGDEIGDEAQAQEPGEKQQGANQGRQRRRRSEQLGRVAVRDHCTELGASEDRKRGGGTDAEHAGGAEQSVDGHRHEGGVETNLYGQARHGGVGHGLGQHDGGRRKPRDDVEAEPASIQVVPVH